MAASKTLKQMLNLLAINNQYAPIIPNQLLIAIFWEETLFQNIEQYDGKNGAVGLGFGQVQENVLPLIKARLSKVFSRGLVAQDDNKAVEVACCALETFRRGFASGSLESAYKVGYASATPELRNQVLNKQKNRTRGQIVDAVWQASLDLKACKWDDKPAVKAALNKCREASNAIFDQVLA